jgi:hypothetical protein
MPHFADSVKQLPGDSQPGCGLAGLKMGIVIFRRLYECGVFTGRAVAVRLFPQWLWKRGLTTII